MVVSGFRHSRSQWNRLLVAAFSLFLFVMGSLGVLALWSIKGRERAVGPVAEYLAEPPADLPPALAGILLRPRLDPPGLREVQARLAEIEWDRAVEVELDLSMFYHPETLAVLKRTFFVRWRDVADAPTYTVAITFAAAAYALARYNFRGKEDLAFTFLSFRFAPELVVIIPLSVIYRQLGLYDTYFGIMWVYQLVTLPLLIWLMRGYFEDVPKDIEQAAKVDGANPVQLFANITVPGIRTTLELLVVLASIFSFKQFSIVYLMTGGGPFTGAGPANLFSATWNPKSGQYGMLIFLTGTLATTVGGLLLGTPLAIGSALFLTQMAPRRVRSIATRGVELLAGVPSIVLGWLGFTIMVPWIRSATGSTGTGLLAACVPGTFESWMLLLRDYGSLRLRDVLEPAIAYARDGYPLVERAAATIQTVENMFRTHWKTSAAVYLPNNEVPKPGTLFTNKTLQYVEQSIAHWIMSAGAMVVMVPCPTGDTARGDVTLDHYAEWLVGVVMHGGADVWPGNYGEEPLREEWVGDRVRDLYDRERWFEANPVIIYRDGQPVIEKGFDVPQLRVKFELATVQGSQVGVNVFEREYLVLQAIVFPGINILWTGCILMFLGTLMAVRKRFLQRSSGA